MPEKLIDVQNATVYRGNIKVFDGFTLTVEQGQSTAMLGPNGAGKSTFLKLLSHELYPVVSDHSWVKILGQQRVVLSELQQQIGLVSQDLQQGYKPSATGLDVVVSGFFGSIGIFQHQQVIAQQRARELALLAELGIADGRVVEDGKKAQLLTSDKLPRLFRLPLHVVETKGFYQVYPG